MKTIVKNSVGFELDFYLAIALFDKGVAGESEFWQAADEQAAFDSYCAAHREITQEYHPADLVKDKDEWRAMLQTRLEAGLVGQRRG